MTVPSTISRRQFIQYLGMGAAVFALPQGMLRWQPDLPFTPINPGIQDALVVPEGFTTQILIKRGDVFTPDGKTLGDNADWTGWYPLSETNDEGLLIINSESVNVALVSGYTEGVKTLEQIALEKGRLALQWYISARWETHGNLSRTAPMPVALMP